MIAMCIVEQIPHFQFVAVLKAVGVKSLNGFQDMRNEANKL